MKDKLLGYFILIILFFLIVSTISYGIWLYAFPKKTWTVSFDRISNLRVSDLIKKNGISVGKIIAITLDDQQSSITFVPLTRLKIYPGYSFHSADKGIMGDREIHLFTGDSTLTPLHNSETLKGTFHPGISDILGSTYKLKDRIILFKTITSKLLSQTVDSTSFIYKFNKIQNKANTYCESMLKAVIELDTVYFSQIDSLNIFIASLQDYSRKLSTQIPQKLEIAEKQINTLIDFIDKMNQLINDLTKFTNKMKDSSLLKEDKVSEIATHLQNIREILNDLRRDALKLKITIKLGFKKK